MIKITLKGAILVFLQSPHSAANCPQFRDWLAQCQHNGIDRHMWSRLLGPFQDWLAWCQYTGTG